MLVSTRKADAEETEPYQYLWRAACVVVERDGSVADLLADISSGRAIGAADVIAKWPEARLHRKIGKAHADAVHRLRWYGVVGHVLDRHPWPSAKARSTDLNVCLALLKFAKDAAWPMAPIGPDTTQLTFTVTASWRQVEALAGIASHGTMAASVGRLRAAGLVACDTAATGFLSDFCTTWTLRVPWSDAGSACTGAGGARPAAFGYGRAARVLGVSAIGSDPLGNDLGGQWRPPSVEWRLHMVWTRAGLGVAARTVWTSLDESAGDSAQGLVRATVLSRNTVRTALDRLQAEGLVEWEGEWRALPATLGELDMVASRLGIASWRTQHAERTQLERERFDQTRTGLQLERRQEALEWRLRRSEAWRASQGTGADTKPQRLRITGLRGLVLLDGPEQVIPLAVTTTRRGDWTLAA